MKINVTKSFLPEFDEYIKIIKKIWDNGILTNNGPLHQEFESKIKKYLNVENFQFLTNGTLALQLALSSLEINDGEIITTPFSYVATTSSILWQRCSPVFVDIEPNNFTIDATKIEELITKKTKAILAVHVFGYPCDVDSIEKIAKKYNLKIIYDGAHAFGSKYKNKSLLDFGDITTISFHSTKLFHTIEGGGCIIKNKSVNNKMDLQKKFGHIYDDHICLGINAKASEFQAAMGLANFPYIEKIIDKRKFISNLYNENLNRNLVRPKMPKEFEYNYAYYPVLFKNEKSMLKIIEVLNKNNIYPRRYFYPSLNNLTYLKQQSCKVSEDISSRILRLPIYFDLNKNEIYNICKIINENENEK